MAEEGQVPKTTPFPPYETLATSKPTSMKRPRDDGGGFSTSASVEFPQDYRSPKRRAKTQDVLFRIVVPSRQIGKVIGKEGSRIQKIREETRATIKIADAIAVSCLGFLCFELGSVWLLRKCDKREKDGNFDHTYCLCFIIILVSLAVC